MTPEEQKAADEKKELIAKAKARAAAKAKLTKSVIIMDVKPWDDETGGRPTRQLTTCHCCFPQRTPLYCHPEFRTVHKDLQAVHQIAGLF